MRFVFLTFAPDCTAGNFEPPILEASYETGSTGAALGPPGGRRVLAGRPPARGDAKGSCRGLYVNRTPIPVSQVIRQSLLGPVVPNQGSDEDLMEAEGSRQGPIGPSQP